MIEALQEAGWVNVARSATTSTFAQYRKGEDNVFVYEHNALFTTDGGPPLVGYKNFDEAVRAVRLH